MTPRAFSRAVLLISALTAMACGEESAELSTEPTSEPTSMATHTEIQALASTDKVLVLGSSVSGGLQSREAQAVQALSPTTQIDVVTAEQWRAMTAQQFMAYRALIIGDAACQSGTEAFQAAVDTRGRWGPFIDGDVALLSTDPVSNGTPQLVENAIRFVLNSVQRRTGMYIALGCAYQGAPANTPVPLLEPFGVFTVQGVPGCADSAHLFEMNTGTMGRDLWDSLLAGNGGCAARSVFTQYPDRNFSFVALAQSSQGTPLPGERIYSDFLWEPDVETLFAGTPYVLVRGAATRGAGCGLVDAVPSGEECDMGDGMNGQGATAGQDPLNTCSYSCHYNWCGDGTVDALYGEECDNGVQNGRSTNAAGTVGTCSSSCKRLSLPPPSHPPVPHCQNVTVVAEYTCGVDANIDSGSYDPDNDLVDCTQSPAGPYNMGNTTVTLTCRDRAYHAASCTGVVTVVDQIAPVVTLNGPANHPQECNRNALYSDPGATATDLCSGSMPSPSRTGVVNMAQPNTYTLTYTSTDAAGNRGTATRTVPVTDTQAPSLTLLGTATVVSECGTEFSDPGASSFDQCAGNLPITRTGTLNTSRPGAYPLRYSAKDPSNNASPERTRTVNVVDTLKPTVSVLGPLSQAVECGGPYVDPGARGSDQCAGTVPATPNGVVNPNVLGTYAITYTARDLWGNESAPSPQRTVTVSDTLPPTITLNGSATERLECGATYRDSDARAVDQCAGPLPVTKTGSVNSRVMGSQTLTYSARDGQGHSATATRTINVTDTLAPSITVLGPLSTSYECGSTYVDPGATASDVCAGDLTASIVATQTGNPTQTGSFNVSYSVRDPSGNTYTSPVVRTVSVNDNAPPVLSLLGPASQALECGSPYTDPGAVAQDACFGDVTARITRSGTVNERAPGLYSLVYNVTDQAGHAAPAVTRSVNVSDTLAPNLTVRGSLNAQVECGTAYNDAGATASDVCTGDLTASIVTTSTVNTAAPGSYSVSYSVADASGNAASGGRAVMVRDTQAPVIQPRPGPSALQCNGAPYVDPGATAQDACRGELTSAITTTSNLDQSRSGTYSVTYRVADASGNVGTAVRMLTVGPCTSCSNIRLGDYNLFLLENYTGGHDVVGKVAAGGNITMTDFAVGSGLPDSNISNTLVAGGNLSLSRGGIWGDAFYGGTLTADQSVTQVRGTRAQGTPINFAARFAELRGLSSQLASMTATGTTRRESWGGISMNGTSSNVNVFDISASAFTGAVYWSINAPAGSLVVVNIRGASASFSSFGISFSGGIDQHGVLFNFVDTTSITAQGFGFWGTVLAPYADVNFNNGSWDGGIYAKSFTGNAEGHINPLRDRDICP
jgi:choice-of-anchor A domain-containing protein